MTLTPELATMIIKSAEATTGAVLQIEDDPVAQAERIIALAEEMVANKDIGSHDPAKRSAVDLLAVARTATSGVDDVSTGSPQVTPAGPEPASPQWAAPSPDDESTPERAVAEELVRTRGLPVPHMPEGEPPIMPRDLTDVSDRTARKLHSEFNTYLGWVTYVIGLERADKEAAERLADYHEKRALREESERASLETEKVTQHVLIARATRDPEARSWRRRATQHTANLSLLYSLKDVYAGNIERLRSDWRMRRDEFDMQGGR